MKQAATVIFRRPPVNEVVCGVQYEGLEQWRTGHYGLFWHKIEDAYPKSEDHAPLPIIRLAEEEAESPEANVELPSLLPPLRRVFFISESGNYLVQLQPHRFLHNWRKVSDSDQYPKFESAFRRFDRYWNEFRSFVGAHELGTVRISTYELTYIDHILAERGASFPRDVSRYLDFFRYTAKPEEVGDPSALLLNLSIRLPGDRGFLSLALRHGRRKSDDREILVLDFTARGKAQPTGDDMSDWFTRAHEFLVGSFYGLTTQHAHREWEEME